MRGHQINSFTSRLRLELWFVVICPLSPVTFDCIRVLCFPFGLFGFLVSLLMPGFAEPDQLSDRYWQVQIVDPCSVGSSVTVGPVSLIARVSGAARFCGDVDMFSRVWCSLTELLLPLFFLFFNLIPAAHFKQVEAATTKHRES